MKKFIFLNFILIYAHLFSTDYDMVKQIDQGIALYRKEYSRNSFTNRDAELTDLYYLAKEVSHEKAQIDAVLLLSNSFVLQKKFYQIIVKAEDAKRIAYKINDYQSLAHLKNYIAGALIYSGFHEEAKKNINKSIEFSKFLKDKEQRKILDYNNCIYLAKYYQFQHKKDSVFYYLNKAIATASEINETSQNKAFYKTDGILHIAEFHLSEKQPEAAEKHLMSISQNIKSVYQTADYLFLQAKIAFLQNNEMLSLELYKKADSLASEINYDILKIKVYNDLAVYYKAKDDLKKHIYYLKNGNTISDSLIYLTHAQIDRISQFQSHESQNFLQSKSVLIVVILLIVLIFVIKRRKTFRKPKPIHIEIEKKFLDIVTPISITELTSLTHDNNPLFYANFKNVFPSFEDKLLKVNPLLKPMGLEVCALMKLNFTTKQIAVIKNVSIRSVEGRKYRIRKALEINQNENIYVWISKL
ncbi:hypothetical protein G6R40_06320 [Chryseobacterium sp. POL2]|uniref:helix-turn-helix transcriptional regulator n=1 Tax=Chryseobacterium sp. POL2 TaxID=2713414 RepID=UPI0013E1D8EE|nr:hypothetical protein [Chryseobacterium sp. POL2]QIG89318.1 hypothetical protein G6R40_06320 [Chryseobacterium sp. POL2]